MNNLTPEQQGKIVRMQDYLERSKLYAQYWMAMATTGVATKRTVSTGNHRFTPEELKEDSLNTALNHIHNMEEAANKIAMIIEGREGEIDWTH